MIATFALALTVDFDCLLVLQDKMYILVNFGCSKETTLICLNNIYSKEFSAFLNINLRI